MELRRQECHVFRHSDRPNANLAHVEPQAGAVGDNNFLVVHQLELVTRIHSTLFYSSLVMDGAHKGGGELEEGAPGSKPVGHVKEALVSLAASGSVGLGQDVLLEDGVKS